MGWVFSLIDEYIMESSDLDDMHWSLQVLILTFIVLPLVLMGIVIVFIVLGLHHSEKMITSLIYRNKITISALKSSDEEDLFYKKLKEDFGYKFNLSQTSNETKVIIYFFRESDLGWFILKYSEYIIKKT